MLLLRRGAGVAELAALEMLCTGNCTVGSNPTLSATLFGLPILIRLRKPCNREAANPARPGTEQR
jgi:hypothetical protein